jgi:hypothetical protein
MVSKRFEGQPTFTWYHHSETGSTFLLGRVFCSQKSQWESTKHSFERKKKSVFHERNVTLNDLWAQCCECKGYSNMC